jgi:predicted DNA-binding antitoxin AbrB/MazE fold protein
MESAFMDKFTDAVFRDGVLRPAQPLGIPDGETVRILVLPRSPTPDAGAAAPLAPEEVEAMLRQIDAMPDLPVKDRDDVGAEHDRYLYGDQSEFAHLFPNGRAGDR